MTLGSTKHGFQLCTINLSVNYVGVFTASVGNQVTHMMHTGVGNTQTSCTFDWTAPYFALENKTTIFAAV